jgi:endoglucanase
MNRRDFITSSTALLGAASFPDVGFTAPIKKTNPIPRWRGFNILEFYRPPQYVASQSKMNMLKQEFQWIADWGFDFVRFPMSYPCYLKYDASKGVPITGEETVSFNNDAVNAIIEVIELANSYGLHVSINLHRAPGFCINAGFQEPFNLWKDEEAQLAFYEHWNMWAQRLKNISSKLLSFDLVNEPCFKEDMNDQYALSKPIPGHIYREVAEGCVHVIHQHNKERLIVADGNHGGALVIPELIDLPIAQSCRGYYPHYISHYQAGWVWKNPSDAPTPAWPGTINNKYFSRDSLVEFYKPWIELVEMGVGVHCGEAGCYNKTPHPIFLSWFEDQLDLLTSHQIGWGLWNFRGAFGLLDSGRADVDYENWHGHKLDKKLLNLLQKY